MRGLCDSVFSGPTGHLLVHLPVIAVIRINYSRKLDVMRPNAKNNVEISREKYGVENTTRCHSSLIAVSNENSRVKREPL